MLSLKELSPQNQASSIHRQVLEKTGFLCYWRQQINTEAGTCSLRLQCPHAVCGWCGTDSCVSGTQHPSPSHTPLLLCAALCTASHSKTLPGSPQSRKDVQCNGVATWQAAVQWRAKLVLVSLPESAGRTAGQLSSRRPCTCP